MTPWILFFLYVVLSLSVWLVIAFFYNDICRKAERYFSDGTVDVVLLIMGAGNAAQCILTIACLADKAYSALTVMTSLYFFSIGWLVVLVLILDAFYKRR